MEGEDRGGWEAGQNDNRLLAISRQTDRLTGFEGDTMHENTRLEFGDDDRIEIALPLGSSTGEEHDIGRVERPDQRLSKRIHIISEGPEENWIASEFADGIGQNAAITVEDESGAHRFAGLHDLVTGRQDCDPRTSHHGDLCAPDRGQHAGLARSQLHARE